MSIMLNMQDAKTSLSRLVAASLAGEEVIIANRGVPSVRLVPVKQPQRRELGFVGGADNWDDSFFDPLPNEELEAWGLI